MVCAPYQRESSQNYAICRKRLFRGHRIDASQWNLDCGSVLSWNATKYTLETGV